MKKIWAFLFVLLCIFTFVNPILAATDDKIESITVLSGTAPDEVELDAQGAVLMALENGQVLFSQNDNEPLYPASTTKVLTALLALENGDLKETVVIGNEANLCGYGSSISGLDIGEEISLGDLLYGLLLPSGNDAAYSIAVHIGRKIKNDSSLSINEALEAFINLMNERSRELGATNSHFANPDGYHHEDHHTTAHDMALIAKEAISHKIFREIIGTKMFTIQDWSSSKDPNAIEKEIRYWRNTNVLIQSNDKFYYPDALGGKTGYTPEAKHCLVALASRNGTELLSVVLGSSNANFRWTDTISLFDYGFKNFARYEPLSKGQQVDILNVTNNPSSPWVRIVADRAPIYFVPRVKLHDIRQEIDWEFEPISKEDSMDDMDANENDGLSLPAPISKYQRVGTMTFKLGDQSLDKVNLLTAESVEVKDAEIHSPIFKLGNGVETSYLTLWEGLSQWQKYTVSALGPILLALLILTRVKTTRRKRGYSFRRRY